MTRFPKALLVLALAGVSAAASASEITVGVYYAFSTLDPYDASDTLSQNVAKSFYEGLFGFDKDMKLQNVLAESYEVSDDGLVYTVKLRKGVKFSDGEPFNAAAVKANFERIINPDKHLTRYTLYKNIDRIEAVDEYTVKFHLKEAFSAFINQLAHPSGVMMCPKILHLPKKDIAFNPCGTGPYTCVENVDGSHSTYQRREDYWGELPSASTITVQNYSELTTMMADFETGALIWLWMWAKPIT